MFGIIGNKEICAQLSERQTEHKYRRSYEQIGKIIRKYSADASSIWWISWNWCISPGLQGTMICTLKTSRCIPPLAGKPVLAPAYDLLNAVISNPTDDEEFALIPV